MKKLPYYLLILSLLCISSQGVEMDPKTFFPGWDLLPLKQQETLTTQIERIDLDELAMQRAVALQEQDSFQKLSVFKDYEFSGSVQDQELGKKLIAEGKVGCLIVAGGQGTRLGFTKPKGLYPVTLIKKKSLFQLFAEKILAAGKRAGRSLYVAIMTSTDNHEETVESFKQSNYFGLNPDQVFFFSQKDLPFLDKEGNLFLDAESHFAMGPNGNASSLKEFVASGIWDTWKKQGVSYVNYMHIDNTLADPFDAELSGFHSHYPKSDMILKCIERENVDEKIGVIFQIDGKVGVVEYSELSKEEKEARNEEGSLKNACANIGLYSFSMDFIHNVAASYYDKLPFHKAWKKESWKFEKFIFDVMPFAQNVKALLYSRLDCFAPLKNTQGEDSLSTVQIGLQRKDRQIFEKITGTSTDGIVFELDPSFYYPDASLLQKWKGKSLPDTNYVDP
jgi:UDP-N-acetylglucosamine/UDP-N-acetylgalactosamine diphosphorylase